MGFGQFFLILNARRWVALAVFIAVVGLAVAASLMLPKKYTAVASVVAENRPDPSASAGNEYEVEQSAYLATQVGIIYSDRVARRVVQALKLDQAPDVRQRWQESTGGRGDMTTWLGDGLKQRLTAAPSGESNVINISVKWSNAQGAAAIANAFAQAYIDTSVDLKVEPARRYAGWFDERSRALRAELEAKQKLLSDYQNEKELIAPDEHLDIESARLAELSSQLVTIQSQLQDSQSRQRQVSGDIDAIPEILQNPVIQTLKSSLSTAESKQKDIATRLGTSHPEYISTESEIRSLRERIARESDIIIASLGNTTQVNLRREREVSMALAAQKKRVLELKQLRDQAADLQNDVVTAQRNLDAVNQRLAQSALEGETQQANVVLLAPATEPLGFSSPNLPINVEVGVFIGLVLGIGAALLLELSNRRVRSDAELPQLLGVPLLGKIAAVTTRRVPALPWDRASPQSQS
jgi:chain length determinant protein EpsF